jgi:hypothetical protein
MLIAYCDDIHILCPPHVANEILLLVAAPASASPPANPQSPILDPSFISTGLQLGPGKQSIYGPSLSDPATRVRVTQILGPSIRLLGDPRIPSFQGKADAILRGEGSTIAPGHPVLGCPVGTDAHVESVIQASADKAAALIPILDRLLLSNDSAGIYAPVPVYTGN